MGLNGFHPLLATIPKMQVHWRTSGASRYCGASATNLHIPAPPPRPPCAPCRPCSPPVLCCVPSSLFTHLLPAPWLSLRPSALPSPRPSLYPLTPPWERPAGPPHPGPLLGGCEPTASGRRPQVLCPVELRGDGAASWLSQGSGAQSHLPSPPLAPPPAPAHRFRGGLGLTAEQEQDQQVRLGARGGLWAAEAGVQAVRTAVLPLGQRARGPRSME